MTFVRLVATAALLGGAVWLVRSPAPRDGPNSLPAPDPHHGRSLAEVALRVEACEPLAVSGRDAHLPAEASVVPEGLCAHAVYVWSESMPLSLRGMEEITDAAGELGIPLTMLEASLLQTPQVSPDVRASTSRTDAIRERLVSAGATVHFPSLVIFARDEPLGSALVGYKRSRAYRALLEGRLTAARAGALRRAAPRNLTTTRAPALPSVAQITSTSDLELVWTHAMARRPGAFFRRAPGTRFISYDVGEEVFFLHMETGERFRGPGFIDLVPTPDGRLFVSPGRGDHGLDFYDAEEVLRRSQRGSGDRVAPIFTDPEMADQYPSVGILDVDTAEGRATYRILVSWFAGLALRDYEVRWRRDRDPDVRPLSSKVHACPDRALSTPMLSKDGREIAARDEASGTTKVFRLGPAGACSDAFDLGRPTSKVAFDREGRFLAFSAPFAGAESGAQSLTYVLDRQAMRTTEVPGSASFGLVIPEFVGPDSLMFLVTASTGRRRSARGGGTEFRMVCCLR